MKKLDESSSPQQCMRFIQDKYVKRCYAPPNYPDPVKEFLENKEKGIKPEISMQE